MKETWRDIPGHAGYQASTSGRIRSVDRELQQFSSGGKTYTRKVKGRVLRPGKKLSGHLSVVLGRDAGSMDVHRLVLLAFVGPRPFGMDSLHLDENPANNSVTNLAYGTRSENLKRCWAAGNRTVHPNFIGARWR